MTSCNGPINLFILYFVCFRREGELLSRQKDVKKISELIYLELTVRMLPVFEIVQFENSPLQKLYRENEYKFWAQWFLGSFRIVWVDTRIGRWYLRQLWTNHKERLSTQTIVCYTAVFSVVTQRYVTKNDTILKTIRYDTKNGCVADYPNDPRNYLAESLYPFPF